MATPTLTRPHTGLAPANTDRCDSGEWDAAGKLQLLYEFGRIAALLGEGEAPFDPDRDR